MMKKERKMGEREEKRRNEERKNIWILSSYKKMKQEKIAVKLLS